MFQSPERDGCFTDDLVEQQCHGEDLKRPLVVGSCTQQRRCIAWTFVKRPLSDFFFFERESFVFSGVCVFVGGTAAHAVEVMWPLGHVAVGGLSSCTKQRLPPVRLKCSTQPQRKEAAGMFESHACTKKYTFFLFFFIKTNYFLFALHSQLWPCVPLTTGPH